MDQEFAGGRPPDFCTKMLMALLESFRLLVCHVRSRKRRLCDLNNTLESYLAGGVLHFTGNGYLIALGEGQVGGPGAGENDTPSTAIQGTTEQRDHTREKGLSGRLV